jgi:hypothetical protein
MSLVDSKSLFSKMYSDSLCPLVDRVNPFIFKIVIDG